jgi:hypothetical protein
MGRVAILAMAAALAASLTGCGRERPAGQPIRLVGDPGIKRDAPFLTWGGVVALDGVPRPVISASAPIMPVTELLPQPDGHRKIRAQIPPDFAAVPWLEFETVAARGDTMHMLRSWPVTTKMAGTHYEVYLPEDRIKPDETPGVRLWPVPDVASRDVETGDVVVPSHTALQLGVGLEPISWDTTVIPVDMTVSAVTKDGDPIVLKTIRLNPREKAHQKWVDATIPLDALAGKTVRFRFAARPSMGPTSVLTLPLWADPTIVPHRDDG